MQLNIDDFIKKSKAADMIYLDSPNNPTGFQFTRNDLKKLIQSFKGPIIIDEAYVEFADSSVVSFVKQFDNLIVVRTLSKAFGLAGLRLGYFAANKKIVDVFSKIIQYPYPLNTLAIQCGILALEKSKKVSSMFSLIKNERRKIIQSLRKTGTFDVFDSNANFVLFDAKGADSRVYNALIEQGISIRKLGKLGKHKGCLRVTVGTPEMNSKFLLAIRDLLE
jgi:histidinol-phosphate aminotransferase